MRPAMSDAAPPLTASETAYFHPHLFAREKSLVDAVPLLHTDKKYDGSELGGAILASALLDAERRGVVTLEVAKASRLFELRKVDALFVKPGPKPDDSLPHSLESRIRPFVQARKEPPEARDVFVAMLQEDAPDPWSWAVALVPRGLSQRGLVGVEEKRTLKVFRSQSYVLPPETAELGRRTPPEPVQRLLESTRTHRPDVWRHLQEAMKKAVAARTERDDDGDFGPSD